MIDLRVGRIVSQHCASVASRPWWQRAVRWLLGVAVAFVAVPVLWILGVVVALLLLVSALAALALGLAHRSRLRRPHWARSSRWRSAREGNVIEAQWRRL